MTTLLSDEGNSPDAPAPRMSSRQETIERTKRLEKRHYESDEFYFLPSHGVSFILSVALLVLIALAATLASLYASVLDPVHMAPVSLLVLAAGSYLIYFMYFRWRHKHLMADKKTGRLTQVNPKNNWLGLFHDEDDDLVDFNLQMLRVAKRKPWQLFKFLKYDTVEVYSSISSPEGQKEQVVRRFRFVREARKLVQISRLYRGTQGRTEETLDKILDELKKPTGSGQVAELLVVGRTIVERLDTTVLLLQELLYHQKILSERGYLPTTVSRQPLSEDEVTYDTTGDEDTIEMEAIKDDAETER